MTEIQRTVGGLGPPVPVNRTRTAPPKHDIGNFKLPQGMIVDRVAFEPFRKVFSERGIPHEVVQQLLDLHVRDVQKRDADHRATWHRMAAGWVDQFHAEHGPHATAVQGAAKAVMDDYARVHGERRRKALLGALDMGMLDRHPALVHFVASMAVQGGGGHAQASSRAPAAASRSARRYGMSRVAALLYAAADWLEREPSPSGVFAPKEA